MSERQIYKEFLPLVNDKNTLDLLQQYANMRINILRGFLETEKDPNRIYETQGAIAELKRFQTLRDEVREKAKNGELIQYPAMRNG